MVNRIWAQFFGRGFVNPIDDMHDGNEPSHPELLNALDRRVRGERVRPEAPVRGDLQHDRRTSGRASRPPATRTTTNSFSRMAVKVLTPGAAVRLADRRLVGDGAASAKAREQGP